MHVRGITLQPDLAIHAVLARTLVNGAWIPDPVRDDRGGSIAILVQRGMSLNGLRLSYFMKVSIICKKHFKPKIYGRK